MNSLPFSQLFRIHQSASVPAGTSVRVFYGKIPDSCKGFIRRIATTVWYPSVTYVVKVDGETFESVDRDIPIDAPLKFDRDEQVLVRDRVEVFAQNSSTNTYSLGMLIDGRAYHSPTMLAEMGYGTDK